MTTSPRGTMRQPLLDHELCVLDAPTQVWSSPDGEAGSMPIHGLFHGDWRYLQSLRVRVGGEAPEPIGHSAAASTAVFHGIARVIDDATPDPRVRVRRERRVASGALTESVAIVNGLGDTIETVVEIEANVGIAELASIKAGAPADAAATIVREGRGATATAGARSVHLEPHGAASENNEVTVDGETITLSWRVRVAPGETERIGVRASVTDPSVVTRGHRGARPFGRLAASGDARLDRWAARALDDLDALVLETDAGCFAAAGAPWFLTLFGRDSLIAARLALPLGTDLALGTLRALAAEQGQRIDQATAEQPGKILHELRAGTFEMPGEGIVLPPRYFGTIDATALWIVLLHEAWRAGLPLDEVRALQPALEAALAWMRDDGDSDGDGFLEYIDEVGTGLANQGWKDSGDSVRFRDGSIAEGPIALCEVQAQACQAALGGAALLDALGVAGADAWRAWADAMRARFRERFWVERDGVRFPAIALDGHKRPVDSLTSNIGQLLGTGLLTHDEEAHIASLLVEPRFASGWGLRTMADDEAAYWPLSYHCGTVWPHDTAVAIEGMLRSGFDAEARVLAEQLVRAAEGFDSRIPELFAGDAAEPGANPSAYPASCRPQAWSAAAVVPVHAALTR